MTSEGVHLCRSCSTVYSGRVSCPGCGHIPRTERLDYDPPEPCDPWRARLDFDGASLDITVRHAGERRLVHEMVRRFGGGERDV